LHRIGDRDAAPRRQMPVPVLNNVTRRARRKRRKKHDTRLLFVSAPDLGEEAELGIWNCERRVRVGVGVGVGTLREDGGWGKARNW
jgi:hypothetical protein